MKNYRYLYAFLFLLVPVFLISGCGEPTDSVLDVMTPPVVQSPPTTTGPNPNTIVIEINTPPEIIDREPDTDLPVFDTAREAIRDDDIDESIMDMLDWIDENCGKTVQSTPVPPVQILFTAREERDRFIEFIQDDLEHLIIAIDDMHEVDGVIYHFLRFSVNAEEATKAENCE